MKHSLIIAFLALLMIFSQGAVAADAEQPVIVLQVEGVINTFSAQYLARGLREAQAQDAQLVVIMLDTPGGLESAMREMAQMLMASPVPTAVYVAPDGARATSAGMFILLAADIAAMAPATHVGAASPVPLGQQEISDVMGEKMTQDAAALIRSIAEKRGRNVDWAQQAVRDNLAVTASEALQLGVIDLIAEDLDALLLELESQSVNGLSFDFSIGSLRTYNMNLRERFFHVITDPNIAYLLLSLGTLLLLAEIADPGLSVAGIGAVVSYIIAFLAFGSLPVNWAGIGLLAVSVVFFLVGLLTDTEFIVSVVGLVPFVLGSMLLFSPFAITSPAAPDVRVSPWLIGLMAISMLAFSFFVLKAVLAAIRRPPQSGPERLIGMQAETLTDLNPGGQVRVGLDEWSAIALEGTISKGSLVVIKGVAGVRLQVVLQTDEKHGAGKKQAKKQ